MSRRREAAELARALALSTQEATNISHLSPHTLSSSKSGTQDSREMELKTVTPVIPRSTSMSDLPPVVRTYAQDMATSTPRHMPYASSMIDPIASAMTPSHSNKEMSSNIQSFTPTRTPLSNPSLPPHVPATSSDSRETFTTSGSAAPAPSSSSKSRPPYSSPNMPIPSSRLSGDKSHVSSSGSSHRPLFSPTQMSSRPSDPTGLSNEPAAPARNVVTYGKPRESSPVKSAGIPALTMARGHSPLKASGPPLLPEPSRFILSQTPEDEEEQEVVEEKPSAKTPPAPKVEVVIPVRQRSISKPPASTARSTRSHSPDPLDSNIERGLSNTPAISSSVIAPMKTPKPTSSSKSRTPVTVMTETQESDTTSRPSRISARQQLRKEKEEKDKEARREARRIRKEKERLEQEAKERAEKEAKSVGPRGSKRGRNEVDESIVVLDPPAKKTSSRESRRTKALTPEVIEILDETLHVDSMADEEVPVIEDEGGMKDGEEQQERVKSATTKNGAKKRKRIDDNEEDGEEEMEDWNVDEDADEEPVERKPKKASVPKEEKRKVTRTTGTKSTHKPDKIEEQHLVVDNANERGSLTHALEQEENDDEIGDEVKQVEKPVSPAKFITESALTSSTQSTTTPAPTLRSPLKSKSNMINTASPSYRVSPGPSNTPGGVKWKTARNDLAAVLSKFGGARQSGMSKRNKIVPLHMKIGPPVKALPPPPPKPSKKKKDESDEEDSDEAEMESDGEGGLRKKKKEKGIEWYMMED